MKNNPFAISTLKVIPSMLKASLPTQLLPALLSIVMFGMIFGGAASAQSPVGTWKGEWSSQSTGHRGPMRANIQPNGAGGYDARFVGRFALIVPFAYRVTLNPTYDAYGNVGLSASKPLGPLLGSYTMQANVIGNQLNGSFTAAQDTGAVRMKRVR